MQAFALAFSKGDHLFRYTLQSSAGQAYRKDIFGLDSIHTHQKMYKYEI